MARVGVVVPVHGFAPYLAETLDAVLAAGPDAVAVVDDGSSLPLALLREHAAGVTLVRREVAGGPAAARAAGLDVLGEVDLIALCDADDAWEDGALAASVAALERTGAGWAFGRAQVVGPDGRATGERWPEPAPGLHPAAAFARELYHSNPLPTSSVVLTRDALARAGGFPGPVRVAEDWELWLRLCRSGADAVCVPESVVRYRRHPGSLTADVAGLAAAQQAVHRAHADLADDATRRRVLGADAAALAAGLARERRWAEARAALREARVLRGATARERVLRAVLGVPGARELVGRRDPYR